VAKVTLTAKSNAMKSYLPFLTIALFLASCSSVYKSGQTPDDVYFSPARPQDEYARVEKRNDRMYNNDDVALEDRYLRMKTRNRRYQFLDDSYDCYCGNYNNYSYYDYNRLSNYYAYNNWWMWNGGRNRYYNPYYYNAFHLNPYYYNPYYGNPYYSGVVYGNVYPVYNKPRRGNLDAYSNEGNSYYPASPKGNSRVFNTQSSNGNYRKSGTNAGGFLRDVFGSGNNNNNNSSSSTQPSSSNSSSGSSSSSSSSGGSRAPVRRF
jgi:hypothetical protein